MKILAVLGCGILCTIPGALLAGWIAHLSVEWHHISSMEGQSAYHVIFLALGGLIAGFVAGLVVSGFVIGTGGGFSKAAGFSVATVLSLAALALFLTWFFGDVPPKLRGDHVMVLIEFRAPEGWQPSRKVSDGPNFMTLRPVDRYQTGGREERNYFDWKSVREEDGRFHIPGVIPLFRSSQSWTTELTIAGNIEAGFALPLGSKLTREQEAWSEWMPGGPPAEEAGGFEYRYRIQTREAWREEQKAAREARRTEARRRLESLPPDAPMREWLAFRRPVEGYSEVITEDMQARAAEAMRARPDDLIALLSDPDAGVALQALEALPMLQGAPDRAAGPLRTVASQIAASIREVARSTDDQDAIRERAAGLSIRFQRWCAAWQSLKNIRELKSPAELEEIIQAASAREGVADLETIAANGRYYREFWNVTLGGASGP